MRKLVLLAALLGMFFVGGCISTSFLGTKEPEADAFAGGTDGLATEFVNLPSTILSETPFDIIISVDNKGETFVAGSAATFTLNNAGIFGIADATKFNNIDLSGIRQVRGTVSPGGQDQIFWQGAIFKGVVLTEQQSVPLAVDACYQYRTTGVSTICIARSDKTCQPIGDKVIESSGAPVQITSLRQIAQPSGGNVELGISFEIANRGSGDVFPVEAICPDPDLNKKGAVTLDSIRLGSRLIKPQVCSDEIRTNCCSETTISTFRGEGSMDCRVSVQTTRDFEEQLAIELVYKYKDKIAAQVNIIPF
ncbi:MAG TPA: hypothetical protein VJ110_03885 [Candidatus Nanoarchaeia archaeon]|nr:hypothetical protein [Candidatus Nanoarchaeia archaeon]